LNLEILQLIDEENKYLLDSIEKNTARKYVSYDELRQKNRTEYASKFSGTKARNGLSFILIISFFYIVVF
jgi:hypothetical protein